jgi:hypothetical protein
LVGQCHFDRFTGTPQLNCQNQRLNAFIAAAVLDPNGIISVDETENKPEPALT